MGESGAAAEQPGWAVAIRDLTELDASAFWQLRLRALREHPSAFGSSYDENLHRSPADVIQLLRERTSTENAAIFGAFGESLKGASDTPALFGILGIIRSQGGKERHKAFIWGMYVADEARGGGVGRRMLIEAIGRARDWPGVELVQLSVVIGNGPARQLYASLGFRGYGVERHALKLDGRYFDEELMELDLAGDQRSMD